MSPAGADVLWVAFFAFGFGVAVVAFTVGLWVGLGVGLQRGGSAEVLALVHQDGVLQGMRRGARAPSHGEHALEPSR